MCAHYTTARAGAQDNGEDLSGAMGRGVTVQHPIKTPQNQSVTSRRGGRRFYNLKALMCVIKEHTGE